MTVSESNQMTAMSNGNKIKDFGAVVVAKLIAKIEIKAIDAKQANFQVPVYEKIMLNHEGKEMKADLEIG